VRRADKLTNFLCFCLQIRGASTSWRPQGLSKGYVNFNVNDIDSFRKRFGITRATVSHVALCQPEKPSGGS